MELDEFPGAEWLKHPAATTGIGQAHANLLTRDRTRQNLLDQFTEAADDDSRAQWLSLVEQEAFWSGPANRYSDPALDEAYGMKYRYDRLLEVYEWEWEHPPGNLIWISQEEAGSTQPD